MITTLKSQRCFEYMNGKLALLFTFRLMMNRNIRYGIFCFAFCALLIGNVTTHIISINMSEQALAYENDIYALKQANIKLETEVLANGSLQSIAAVAKTQGYKVGDSTVQWIAPIIASR